MHGQHIDQHTQHWPGGIWWSIEEEQEVKAKKGLPPRKWKKSSKRVSQGYMP